jgi:predicted permease
MQDTGAGWIGDVGRDIRMAGRSLRRTPGFTLSVAGSLALGFALVAAAIGIAKAYVEASFPYPDPDRLHHVRYAPPGPVEPRGMSSIDWQALSDVVEADVTSSSESYYIADGGHAQTARGLRVSPGFLSALGVRAAIGRSLLPEDFDAGSGRVALIGHTLWRTRFGSDSSILGRDLRLEPEGGSTGLTTVRVVGVLAPGFWHGRDSQQEVEILEPLRGPARTYMVRLGEGVTMADAERRLTEGALAVATWLPPGWQGVVLESVHDRYVAGLRPVLVAICVAAALVLLITCINIAVLLVLRTLRRQKEIALRVALGAGRGILFRMFAVEIGLICVAGLGAGLALGIGTLRLLAPLIQERLGRPAPGGTSAMAIDGTVVVMMGVVGVLIALTLTTVPAWMPWQARLSETLRHTGRLGADSRSMRRVRSGLIALEVAGSVALLVACGLMVRTAVSMMRADLVFEREHLLRGRVVLRGNDYPNAAAFQRFYQELDSRLSALSAPPAFTNWPPFIEVPPEPLESDSRPDGNPASGVMTVGERFFELLGLQLRQGRGFSAADRVEAAPVAIVSETLARNMWPDGAAVGRRIRQARVLDPGEPAVPWRTVVGVVADARQSHTDANLNDLYIPFRGSPGRFGSFYVRSEVPPSTLTATLRVLVAELDPHALVGEVRLVAAEDRELRSAAFMTSVLTAFAALAGFLAVLGIYGAAAYVIQQRKREIAIRMAIGASEAAVIGLLLREGVRVVAYGILLGSLGAILLARVLRHQLIGVEPFDMATVAVACLLMTVGGVAATWWPAWRAANRSPLASLNEN